MSSLPDIFYGSKIPNDFDEKKKKEIEQYYEMVSKIIKKQIDDMLEKLGMIFEKYINKLGEKK